MRKGKPLRPAMFAAIVCFLLVNFSTDVGSEDWKVYGKIEPYFVEYYNPGSLSYPEKHIAKLWIKSICADKNKCRELHKEWIDKGVFSPAYERWAYRLSLVEIQCQTKKFRYVTAKNFDENGKRIDRDEPDEKPTNWVDLKNPWGQPEPLEDLYKIVCKQ